MFRPSGAPCRSSSRGVGRASSGVRRGRGRRRHLLDAEPVSRCTTGTAGKCARSHLVEDFGKIAHETRFELAFPSRSSISHTRRSLIARVSPFRWHALKRKGHAKLTSSPRHKKARPSSRDRPFLCWSTRPDSNWRPSRWQRDAGVDFIEEFHSERSYRVVSINSGGRLRGV